jgi:hypothetical protein
VTCLERDNETKWLPSSSDGKAFGAGRIRKRGLRRAFSNGWRNAFISWAGKRAFLEFQRPGRVLRFLPGWIHGGLLPLVSFGLDWALERRPPPASGQREPAIKIHNMAFSAAAAEAQSCVIQAGGSIPALRTNKLLNAVEWRVSGAWCGPSPSGCSAAAPIRCTDQRATGQWLAWLQRQRSISTASVHQLPSTKPSSKSTIFPPPPPSPPPTLLYIAGRTRAQDIHTTSVINL